jgi:thioredoxin
MSTTTHDLPSLSATTFDELIGSSTVPVVVDFTARWCGPCGPMKQALADVTAQQEGRFVAALVDVDDEPDLTRRFGVMSMPTLLVFVGGELVHRTVGARGPRALLEDLSPWL